MRWFGLGSFVCLTLLCTSASLLAVPLSEKGIHVAVAFKMSEMPGEERVSTPGLLKNYDLAHELYRVRFKAGAKPEPIEVRVHIEGLEQAMRLVAQYTQVRDARESEYSPFGNISPKCIGIDISDTDSNPKLFIIGYRLNGSHNAAWIPIEHALPVVPVDRFVPEPVPVGFEEFPRWKYLTAFYGSSQFTKYARVWIVEKKDSTPSHLKVIFREEQKGFAAFKNIVQIPRRDYIEALSVVESAQSGAPWVVNQSKVAGAESAIHIMEVAVDVTGGTPRVGISYETLLGRGPFFATVDKFTISPTCWKKVLGSLEANRHIDHRSTVRRNDPADPT